MSSVLERAAVVMRDFHAPWGIAGGWALDLFAGSESRIHSDVDIAILRADRRQLRSPLSGRVEKVVDHRLAELSAECSICQHTKFTSHGRTAFNSSSS